MVAVGLLAFIIIGLVLTFNQVQRAFRAGTGQSDVLEGGRAVMSVVTRDLQELSASNVPQTLNFFATPRYQESKQVLPSGDQRFNSMYDLLFISKQSDEYRIIAYRLNAERFNGVIGELGRFETNCVLEDLAFHMTNNHVFQWVDRTTNFHRVGNNVVHFRITPYHTNGIPFSDTNNFFDNNRLLLNSFYAQRPRYGESYAFTNNVLPAYVEVELGVMEPSAAEKVRIRADINQAQGDQYFSDRVGRVDVFRQRVPIRSAATQIRPSS
jgi:hypothetical protein